jgi:hypothetical protein
MVFYPQGRREELWVPSKEILKVNYDWLRIYYESFL